MSTSKSVLFSVSLCIQAALATTTLDPSTAFAQRSGGADSGESSFVRMRTIDRATVRIFALTGMAMEIHSNDRTRRERAVAVAQAGHGTGVIIDAEGFIVTAAHVVDRAQQIAVVLAGENEGYPADVVYTDPVRDIAIIRAARTFTHYVPLPARQPTVQLGDRVGITGYPLTSSERMPAAASGEISRLTNEGSIQLAASINPGNSGGPVVDGSGALIGVVSSRLRPQDGAQGIAFVEPIAPAIRAFSQNVRRSRALEGDPVVRKDLAQVVVATLRAGSLGLTSDPAVTNRLISAIDRSEDTDAMALFAGYLWNGITGRLEDADVDTIDELSGEDQRAAVARFGVALGLARRALRVDRTIARRYQIVQDIAEIGERVERSARQGAARPRASEPRAASQSRAFQRASHHQRTFVAASQSPGATGPEQRPFTRSWIEIGGGMTIPPNVTTRVGGGGFFGATHDALRWEPTRVFSMTFLSVGAGLHMAANDRSLALNVHGDVGLRLRVGDPDGVSFSLSGHYTPGLALSGRSAPSRGFETLVPSPMYVGYRVDGAVNLTRHIGMSMRFTDQYTPGAEPALRMLSMGLIVTL